MSDLLVPPEAALAAVVPTLRVADDITELVGGTPLLRLRTKGAAPGARVLAKLESGNPMASVKDRAALSMIRAAEAEGRLVPGRSTIVEATSGNTGIALAGLAAALGYRCVIVLPDNATEERVMLIRAFGAEVVLSPREERMPGAIARAEELERRIPGAWFARQHENSANPGAHYSSTGPEIWAATEGRVDVLVCGVGTGGTLTGTAAFLKERNPLLHVVAVEPAGAPLLSGGEPGTHAIPGLLAGLVAPVTDIGLIDEVMAVRDEDALAGTEWLARRAGVLAGLSSGAATHAAGVVAAREHAAGRTVVTLLPDTGERYLSTLPGLREFAEAPYTLDRPEHLS